MKIGKFILLGLLAYPILTLWAEPRITAKVSSTDISLNDVITLTVEVSGGGNVQTPNLSIPNFQVQSAGRTQSMQYMNGQMSSMLAFNYALRPLKTGQLTIPAITLTQNNQIYKTESITITVREDQAARKANPSQPQSPHNVPVPAEGLKPVFMTAKVDKSKAYVGEQLLLTIQFLRRPGVPLASQPRYEEPDMTGFLVEKLKQQEFVSTLKGTQYQVTELRYALFPTSDGEFAIGNARIDVAIRSRADPFSANSLFDSFFGRTQTLRLNTRGIPIYVRSLPENKPPDFSGAVGRFKLSAHVDTQEPEVGKPLNLTVRVEGVGNIKTIKEPNIKKLSTFRRYETLSNSSVNSDAKFIHGFKEFKILLIPQVSGPVTIPPIAFSFFNPDLNRYQTVTSKPLPLQVKPGTLSQTEREVTSTLPKGQIAEGVKIIEKDIRFLKSGKLKPLAPPLYHRGAFLALNSLPFLFALGVIFTRWKTKHRMTYAAEYRSKGAMRKASATLNKAKALLTKEDPAPYYATLHVALTGFLADKFGLSAAGLLWEDVDQKLSDKKVGDSIKDGIRSLLDDADMARFATTAFDLDHRKSSLEKTKSMLGRLNRMI